MTRLTWDVIRLRTYEVGVDRGVFYSSSGPGVVWPGLVQVSEINANQDVVSEYLDGRKFFTSVMRPDFQAQIQAFTTPRGFEACEGQVEIAPGLYATNQIREPFGFSYRTLVGNPVEGSDHHYRIHVVYNAIAVSEGVLLQTMSDSPESALRQWTIHSIPHHRMHYTWFESENGVELIRQESAYFPVSHLSVSSRTMSPETLGYLEDVLYGTDSTSPSLPSPDAFIEIVR